MPIASVRGMCVLIALYGRASEMRAYYIYCAPTNVFSTVPSENFMMFTCPRCGVVN